MENKKDDIKLYHLAVYNSNPFMDRLKQHMVGVKKNKANGFLTKSVNVIDDSTGEVYDHDSYLFFKKYPVDGESFTKVFHDQMKMMGLSDRAAKLLMFVTSRLEKNQLQVDLDPDEMSESFGVSKPTYYRALSDLIVNEVLARTKYTYRFFINPVYIFNGDRMVVVNEYINTDHKPVKSAGGPIRVTQLESKDAEGNAITLQREVRHGSVEENKEFYRNDDDFENV